MTVDGDVKDTQQQQSWSSYSLPVARQDLLRGKPVEKLENSEDASVTPPRRGVQLLLDHDIGKCVCSLGIGIAWCGPMVSGANSVDDHGIG